MSPGPACRHTHAHISYFPSLFIRIAVGRGPLFESPWLLCHNRRAWWPIVSSGLPSISRATIPHPRGCSLFLAAPFPPLECRFFHPQSRSSFFAAPFSHAPRLVGDTRVPRRHSILDTRLGQCLSRQTVPNLCSFGKESS